MITEAELAERRPSWTLAERVAYRRQLDAEAGINYPPLSLAVAARIAALLTP